MAQWLNSYVKIFITICTIVAVIVVLWIVKYQATPVQHILLYRPTQESKHKPSSNLLAEYFFKKSAEKRKPYKFTVTYRPRKYLNGAPIRVCPMIPQKASFRADSESRDPGVRTDHNSLLSDVFFGMKTTEKLYESRLKYLLTTMLELDTSQVIVITDTDTTNFAAKMHGFPLALTTCGTTHVRFHQACKYDRLFAFLINNTENYRWLCTYDDDTYFNYVNLMGVLNRYNWKVPTMVGKTHRFHNRLGGRGPIYFVDGGPGTCMSTTLIQQLAPYARDKQYEHYCNSIGCQADTCLGAFAFMYAGVEGIHEGTMYRLLDRRGEDILKSLTSVCVERDKLHVNPGIASITPAFNDTYDPTRVLTLQCHYHPEIDYCAPLYHNKGVNISKTTPPTIPTLRQKN